MDNSSPKETNDHFSNVLAACEILAFRAGGRTIPPTITTMSIPPELVSEILFDLWSIQSTAKEHIQTFENCTLVSKYWSAIMKEVNSTHSIVPFSYNGGQLYTIRAMSSMSNPLLCRTITLNNTQGGLHGPAAAPCRHGMRTLHYIQ